MQTFDLEALGLRALNSTLHGLKGQTNQTAWEIINPKGAHAVHHCCANGVYESLQKPTDRRAPYDSNS